MTDKIMINENNEKPNLFLVLTDGEPQGKTEPKFMPISAKGPSIKNRFHHLRAKLNGPKNSPMVFSLCGDSHNGRDFLNWVDENIEQTATLDDFPTESQQVFSAQGNSFKYDFIDYSLNHILAALDENFDNLDEKNSPLLTQSFLENNIYGRCLEDSEYMNYRHEANKARKNKQPTQLKRVNFPLPGLRTVLKYNAKNTQKTHTN